MTSTSPEGGLGDTSSAGNKASKRALCSHSLCLVLVGWWSLHLSGAPLERALDLPPSLCSSQEIQDHIPKWQQ